MIGHRHQCMESSGDVSKLPVMEMSHVLYCGIPSERDPKQTIIGKFSVIWSTFQNGSHWRENGMERMWIEEEQDSHCMLSSISPHVVCYHPSPHTLYNVIVLPPCCLASLVFDLVVLTSLSWILVVPTIKVFFLAGFPAITLHLTCVL